MQRRTMLALLTLPLAGCTGGDKQLDQRGQIELRIDGEQFDLTADRFQAEYADDYALAFHLHADSERWYNEGDEPVTIAEGLDLLPEFMFDIVDEGYVLTIDDETYDTREDGTTIDAFVNGDSVDIGAYELADGDDLHVDVETDE